MKIALIGYGKMGKTIDRLATEKGHEVLLRIDKANAAELNAEQLNPIDVAIEFSRPDTVLSNVKTCLAAHVPVVCGTTGWLEHYEEVKSFTEHHHGAFLYASNFSIGVNLFFELNKQLARLMNVQTQYEVKMEEIHHTEKLDAPSGTAITLAEGILDELNRKDQWVNDESSSEHVLPIISKRLDKVPGTHRIAYDTLEDTIKIEHIAHSREGFGKGALHAAEWIIGKQGCFSMSDVLGF